MKASMFMDRDGIHSSRDEHEGKEETCGDATARSTARGLRGADADARHATAGRTTIPYLRQHLRRLGDDVLARRRRRRLRRARADHPKLRRPRGVEDLMVERGEPPSHDLTQ